MPSRAFISFRPRAAEAYVGGRLIRANPVAEKHGHPARTVGPCTTAHDPVLARRRSRGILLRTLLVVSPVEPVADPLGHAAGHIEQAVSIGLELPHRTRTIGEVESRLSRSDFFTPRKVLA